MRNKKDIQADIDLCVSNIMLWTNDILAATRRIEQENRMKEKFEKELVRNIVTFRAGDIFRCDKGGIIMIILDSENNYRICGEYTNLGIEYVKPSMSKKEVIKVLNDGGYTLFKNVNDCI